MLLKTLKKVLHFILKNNFSLTLTLKSVFVTCDLTKINIKHKKPSEIPACFGILSVFAEYLLILSSNPINKEMVSRFLKQELFLPINLIYYNLKWKNFDTLGHFME